MKKERFTIQELEYVIPYHHLVDFKHFSNAWIMPWGQEYYTYIKKVLVLSKNFNPRSIIDIGCGDGKVSYEFARLYGTSLKNVGIDLSERAIMLAKGLNWGNGAEFFCASVSAIQETFELATLIEVLEHVPDDEVASFVSNIRERLILGGILIISVPSDCIRVSNKHYRHYNPKLLSEHLKGFELMEIYYLVKSGFAFNLLNHLIRKFASICTLRNFFFKIYMRWYAEGNEKSCHHLVAVFKKM